MKSTARRSAFPTSPAASRQRFAIGAKVEPYPNIFTNGFDPVATRAAVQVSLERAPGLETTFNGERFRASSLLVGAKRIAPTA